MDTTPMKLAVVVMIPVPLLFRGLRPAASRIVRALLRSRDRPTRSVAPALFSSTKRDNKGVWNSNGSAVSRTRNRMHAGRASNRWRDYRPNRSLRPLGGESGWLIERRGPILRWARRHTAEDAPILCSVPLTSRAMLARCMIHNSAVSKANSTASARSPSAQSATGVAALATSAASEE